MEPLSEELADRLRSVPEPLRALEYDEEIYPESSPAQIFEPSDPMAPLSAVSDTQSNWLPNIEKVCTRRLSKVLHLSSILDTSDTCHSPSIFSV